MSAVVVIDPVRAGRTVRRSDRPGDASSPNRVNADPACLTWSVHEPIDDEAEPLSLIQAYGSVAGFEEHGQWMQPNVGRPVPVLASPPDPPVLLRSASPGGDPKSR